MRPRRTLRCGRALLLAGLVAGCAGDGENTTQPAGSASIGPDGLPLDPTGAEPGEPSNPDPSDPESSEPDGVGPESPSGVEPESPGGPDSPDSPNSPDAPGVPEPGTPDSPDGTPDTPDVSEPATPANAGQEFTRLTRREYQVTVEAALGIEIEPNDLPVDGRVGVFTSNVGVTPDPVHPYLLAAESIAADVVPNVLQACEGDVAECVRSTYAEPIGELYRRDLSDAELDALTTLVSDLLAQGATPDEATRAMLGSALLSPDFLFRSSPSNGAGASTRRLVERLSYALWDAPPDDELQALVGLTDGEVGAALSTQVDRVGSDSRATVVLARFVGQWLDVDTDRLREDDAEFDDSPPHKEHLTFVENAVANDVPIKELLTSSSGFVHEDNVDDYPELDDFFSEDEVSSVEWPEDSIRRGILGQDLFAASTRHPDESRRVIFRGLLVRRSLMCDDIPAPSADLVALAGEVGDRTEDSRCSTCHQLLDPIGVAFGGLDPDFEGDALPAEVLGNSDLAGTYDDLPSLLTAIAGSRRFAECFSRHFLSFFLERTTSDVDDAWVARLADSVEADATLLGLTELVMADLAQQSPTTIPWCEGE